MRFIILPVLLLASFPAAAWDPNEGAYYSPPTAQPLRLNSGYSSQPYVAPRTGFGAAASPAPASTVQPLALPAPAAAQPIIAPAPVFAPPPAPMAAASVVHYRPAEQPAAAIAPEPIMVPSPPPVQEVAAAPGLAAMPAPMASAYGTAPVYAPAAPLQAGPAPMGDWNAAGALPADRIALGLEVYYDNYKEDSVDLDSDAYYGGITGDYQHFFDPRWFGGIDGRAAYGRNDYSSITGEVNDVPQWEFEGRAKGGYRWLVNNGTLDLYSGIGARYYQDDFKGENSTIGGITFFGYDRNIFQAYLPVGLTHTNKQGSWTFRTNFEADALLYGNVSSRLGTIPGYGNIENRQDAFSGWGARGEFTLGQLDAGGAGWEAGPYFRYWYADDTDPELDSVSGDSFIEPENTRLQVGLTGRLLF